ncbi:MAG: endonuclease/exonuclease/phosphatase family protein [Verrucomicrobia bacterium]|nr:endonuclease/exonuclease/phosphatase family protein [Verrucomicrobiota bacterium]
MNFKFLLILAFFSQVLCADSFRLVTYNILSDDYAHGSEYDYVGKDLLDWQNRRSKIVERVKNLDPDVICLQEVDTDSFEYFKEAFEGFEGSFAKKGSSSKEGIGTFCKKDVFKETSHKAVLCEGTSNCGCAAVQPALFTKLILHDDQSITLVNTKIKYSKDLVPGGPIWNHVQCILKSIPKTAAIVAGDFNMEPGHPFMQDFYSAGLNDRSSTYSFYEDGNFQRIDYILTTDDLKSVPIESISSNGEKPIPNEEEPSDHLPVGSVIAYE